MTSPPRFALLAHDHPFPHWDLLLESVASCRTWRLLDDPALPGPWRAEPLGEHRLMYLDYEGPVSGNRGTVTHWDAGELIWLAATEETVIVILVGQRWSGRLQLTRRSPTAWSAQIQSDDPSGEN